MIQQFLEDLSVQELQMSAEQIADILWLLVQTNPPVQSSKPESISTATKQSSLLPELFAKQNSKANFENVVNDQKNPDIEPASVPPPPVVPRVEVYPKIPSQTLPSLPPQKTLKIPDGFALPNIIGLSRALRPFTKRIPSQTQFRVNETLTADRTARTDLLLPIFEAEKTKWFGIDFVVDISGSMIIWDAVIRELRQMLLRLGAFRDLRTWSLHTEKKTPIVIYKGLSWTTASQTPRSSKELIDPRRQRLIVIISDCVSDAWHSGSITQLMTQWAKFNPLAIMQVLPEKLWERTALGFEKPIAFKAFAPGWTNVQYVPHQYSSLAILPEKKGVLVPVLTLDPIELNQWAQLLVNGTNNDHRFQMGYFFEHTDIETFELNRFSPSHEDEAQPISINRVKSILARTSPPARRLVHSLAGVPITLPIIRLVQQVLHPAITQAHVAEVLLGGLLQQETPIEEVIHPDDILYDFVEDKIRTFLLEETSVSHTTTVIKLISTYVEEKIQARRSVLARLGGDSREDVEVMESKPFARIKASILRLLGLNEEADKLEATLAIQPQADSIDAGQILSLTQRLMLSLYKLPSMLITTLILHILGQSPRMIAERLSIDTPTVERNIILAEQLMMRCFDQGLTDLWNEPKGPRSVLLADIKAQL